MDHELCYVAVVAPRFGAISVIHPTLVACFVAISHGRNHQISPHRILSVRHQVVPALRVVGQDVEHFPGVGREVDEGPHDGHHFVEVLWDAL